MDESNPSAASTSAACARVPPAISVQGLSFAYAADTPVLRDVSLTVPAGQRLGLVGPNGAGKTTLLWHLNGLLPTTARPRPALITPLAIQVEGTPLTASTVNDVRRRVGLVFQNPDDQIFAPTVWEEVLLGPLAEARLDAELIERATRILAAVGLGNQHQTNPDRLSDGQRRRLCIAAILTCQPTILLLDEPTANLDPVGRRELVSLLRQLPMTQIIATHDLEFALDVADRVVVMAAGQVVGDGVPSQVLADHSLMHQYGLEVPWSLRDDRRN